MTPLRSLLHQSLQRAEAARRLFIQPHSNGDTAATFYEARGFAQGVAAAIEAVEKPKHPPTDALFDPGLPDPSRLFVQVARYAPSASQQAAKMVRPATGTQRARVLEYIADRCQIAPFKGATDEEIQVGIRLGHNSESPRRRELVVDGWIVGSGETRRGASGAQATVWILSEAGLREMRWLRALKR